MILWEFPLAFGSFLFYRTTRMLMRGLLRLHDARLDKEAQKWIVLSSDDLLARPGALPLIMTTGPRWNTHAIIATLSPVCVRQSLEINAASADRSAGSWTIVVCTYPKHRTVTSVGSFSPAFPNGTARVDLAPGKYWLGLRYYEWGSTVELPAVRADGREVAPAQPVSAQANSFYRALHGRSSAFYLALHYYVFILLRYRRLFPERFVRREFLPVGNPETEFFFGALRKGEELRVRLAPQAFADWNVLLTLYNRASFPLQSEHLKTRDFRIGAAGGDRIYLFRVHRKSAGPQIFQRDWLQLQTE